MSMSAQKKEHRRELSAKDDELEDARTSTQKKVCSSFLLSNIYLFLCCVIGHAQYISKGKINICSLFYIGKGPGTAARI